MSKWEKVRLCDIQDIKSGGTPSTKCLEYYTNGDIPWVKTGDLKQKYILSTNDMITQDAVKNSSAKIFPVGTVLLAMYGATIGACSILSIAASTNQACAAFLPCDKILSEYLYYCLLANKKTFINDGVGGAQPNISSGYLKQYEIPLPPLAEQQKIADTLDKVSHLIALRKEQLSKLDLLVKAKFVEMFGDPVENPMGWEKVELKTVLKVVGGYAFRSECFQYSGIPVLRIGNINAGYFKPTNLVFWEKESRLERYILQPGDLVISLTGTVGKDDYGNVCILGDEYSEYYLNQRNAKLELNNKINTHYLTYILKIPKVKSMMTGISRGVRQANISNGDILDLNIPLPPLALQTQFADYVTQVETSKQQIQQGLEKLETLYQGLMQAYFE